MWYERTDVQESKHFSPSVNQFKSATWRQPVFLPWALCLSSFCGQRPVFLLSKHVCVGTLPVFLLSQHVCVGTLSVFLTVFHCCKMAVRQISTGLRLLLGFIHPADLLVAVHLLVPVPFPSHVPLVVTAS